MVVISCTGLDDRLYLICNVRKVYNFHLLYISIHGLCNMGTNLYRSDSGLWQHISRITSLQLKDEILILMFLTVLIR